MSRGFVPWPAKVLRSKAAPVDAVNDEIRALWDEMIDAMDAMPGVGLAAPQIGVPLRLAVVDASDARGQAVRMANPEILHASVEPREHEEASPNLPGVSAVVSRPRAVTVRFLNPQGDVEERDFVGLWATSVQHQIDHLEGRMYFDRLSKLKRDRLLKRGRQAGEILMRVVFMGTPDFSVPVLEALVAAGHDVVCAYSQPPRPAGRGKKDRPSPVQARAEALGIPVRHPVSLKGAAEQADFAALGADVAVVVAYGLLLPQPVLDAPKHGCLNIHASLLPRWRGAAPIHRAIMAGDARTGVCIMQMEAGLDTGPVLLRREVGIGADETTGALHDRLSALGAEAIVEALSRLPDLVPEPQPDEGVTYAAKIDKAEARVDWSQPAAEIVRQINGLSPFPGAWAEIAGERVKLLSARLTEGGGVAGTHLGDFAVACGTGAVQVVMAQRAGKRAMDAADVLRGWDGFPTRLD